MSSIESLAREFAEQFPTPNARHAIDLAEQGRITWEQVAHLFADAAAKAMPRTCTGCGELEGSTWARPHCTYPERNRQ